MSWIIKTYVVISSTPVVVEDPQFANSTSYQPGAVFTARENNGSIAQLLEDERIVEVLDADPTAGFTVIVGPEGPEGPQGPAGGGGGDLASTLVLGNITGGNNIVVTNGDNLVGASDGAWSIGAVGLLRPANIYVATQVVVGNTITITAAAVTGSGALGLASTGGTADLTLTGRSTAIALNEAAELTLDTTNQSLVGAINENVAAIAAVSVDLPSVLVAGNTTGATSIVISSGQQIGGGRANFGAATAATADGDFASGDGAREMFWDASVGNLKVTNTVLGQNAFDATTAENGNIAVQVTNSGSGNAASATLALVSDSGNFLARVTSNAYIPAGILTADTVHLSSSPGVSGGLRLATEASAPLEFWTNSTIRWNISSAGHLLATDNTYDIGASGATRPRTGYFGAALNVGNGITPSTANGDFVFGDGTNEARWDASLSTMSFTTPVLIRGLDGTLTGSGITIRGGDGTGGFLSQGGDVNIIGGEGRDNPSGNVNITGGLSDGDSFGGDVVITGGECSDDGDGGNIILDTGFGSASGGDGIIQLLSGGSLRWVMVQAGHLTTGTDNILDIGASGATRPRSLFLGTALNVGDGITPSTTNGDIVAGNGSNSLVWDATNGELTIPNLTVNGTTTTIDTEIQTADNFILLNSEYTADAPQTAGLVLNIDPAATSFSISAIATNIITVTAGDPSAVLSVADFILIQDPANSSNAGVFEVVAVDATTITVDATPAEAFSSSNLTDDATTQGTVVGIQVAAIRSNTVGEFETGTGTSAPLTWVIIVTGIVEADKLLVDYVTTGLAIGDCVRVVSTDTAGLTDADADATSDFVGVVETVGTLGTGKVVTDGVIPIRFAASLTLGAGDPVFLAETGGVDGIATNVEPATVGAVSYQIGWVKDPTGYAGTEGELAEVQLRFGGRIVIA